MPSTRHESSISFNLFEKNLSQQDLAFNFTQWLALDLWLISSKSVDLSAKRHESVCFIG